LQKTKYYSFSVRKVICEKTGFRSLILYRAHKVPLKNTCLKYRKQRSFDNGIIIILMMKNIALTTATFTCITTQKMLEREIKLNDYLKANIKERIN